MFQGQGVYILKSQRNFRYYIGSTHDIRKRFKEHSDGLVISTRNLRPLELVFFQGYDDLRAARKIEYKLKKFKSRKIVEQIISDNEIKLGH